MLGRHVYDGASPLATLQKDFDDETDGEGGRLGVL